VAGGPLYAPVLVSVEVTNILRRLERARQITTAAANAAYEDLLQLDIELFPFQPFSQRIWELRHTVTSYDAWYVALAESIPRRSPHWTESSRKPKELRASF
jgi:predicted nucleic acid-binding protein